MNDRELLELAAKAAGMRVEFTNDWPVPFIDGDVTYPAWNPLADDSEAFRLSVKLEMRITNENAVITAESYFDDDYHYAYVVTEGDPYAAARRAIVYVAAEIGRNMK